MFFFSWKLVSGVGGGYLLPGIGLDLVRVAGNRLLNLLDHLERLHLLGLCTRAHEVGRVTVQCLKKKRDFIL